MAGFCALGAVRCHFIAFDRAFRHLYDEMRRVLTPFGGDEA